MPELEFSSYLGSLTQQARRSGTPIMATFEITPACNLRCHFCYVALDPYQGPYLSTAQVEQVLDTLSRAGVLMLTLTGGEVFSRRDFPEVYRAARARGFLITVYTNATLVTEAHARLLAEEPPLGIEVSIYGADAAHYEGTTGIVGSFARFERGMDRLLAAGLGPLITVKHPVSTLTADHVDDIRAWCEARGLRHKFAAELENRHDGGQAPSLYRLESRKVRAVKDDLHEARTGGKRPLPLAECAVAEREPGAPERLYQCLAGRTTLFVDAVGRASHCVIDREPSFPILEMPWDELWKEMRAWVDQPLPADAPCSGCSLRSGCNNCPARARLATGDRFDRDPYHCDLTHDEHGLPPARAGKPRQLSACVA